MTTANNTLETLLNEHDIARITGLSVASVRRWRLLKQGPRYLKLGAAVRYKAGDVSAWLESRPTGGELNPKEVIEEKVLARPSHQAAVLSPSTA